ncbi:hypothetical protein L198_05918 [Cryptococcus wingfieldii CBS 7118]|uniref:Solute carrier family 40 member n=1 Tax=Cryptococcus wingfieldii CBS 7118 TaxID=1295528 RepID=A0A1E3IS16_9TREE|nr:hypothetical protein L198_05918 [Cryptococcus wingfieldii CBS 7118]ODN91404.1 hypothetical protein L198_05918 [Cryptococcus wingfieldii CBS 7118]
MSWRVDGEGVLSRERGPGAKAQEEKEAWGAHDAPVTGWEVLVSQRLSVAGSRAIFYWLTKSPSISSTFLVLTMIVLAVLACIEKVSSIANLVSVEEDWVVVVAGDDSSTLAALNSQMRHIDLVCKLLGPLSIALLDGDSTKVAIGINLLMNITSVLVEYFAIAQVYSRDDDRLKLPKSVTSASRRPASKTKRPHPLSTKIRAVCGSSPPTPLVQDQPRPRPLPRRLVFAIYSERPFVAASGLVVRTILSHLGLRTLDSCTQIIVQELSLVLEVEPEIRGIFSSIESAWQNAFELLTYTSTIIFLRPDQFHYPVWLSVGAVATAILLFSNFVWHRRGHLLHPEKTAGICGCHER